VKGGRTERSSHREPTLLFMRAQIAPITLDSLGIDAIGVRIVPDQKASVVKRSQSEGRIVAMAGDGINDAPALAQRTSASLWGPAPTSRLRALGSRWSRAIYAVSR
jgi:hypothetical protein